jgi:hypothetical protein
MISFAIRPLPEIVDTFEAHPWYRTKLLIETNLQGERMLTGFSVSVKATHPHLATMYALDRARKVMHALRVRHYIPTHIHDVAKVNTVVEANTTYIRLPQPFWPKATGRRAIPRLPEKLGAIIKRLEREEQNRWYAAAWHLSEAFSDWHEDVHTAAAKVWQALESCASPTSGSSSSGVFQLAEQYMEIAPIEIAKFLAYRVGVQYREYNNIFQPQGNSCDWCYWNMKRVEIMDWLWRVLNPSSYNYYANWKNPIAPNVVFHPKIGLLQMIARKITQPASERWMEKRIKDDLALLYGLRNRVVHRGSRILPIRMADYLGRLGAEIILTLINTQRSS